MSAVVLGLIFLQLVVLTEAQGTNPCDDNSGNCSHFCQASATNSSGHSCSCISYLVLDSNQRDCIIPPTILISDFTRMLSMNLDGSALRVNFGGQTHVEGLDFDYRRNFVFWSDEFQDRISRGRLDGSDRENIVVSGLLGVRALAWDWVNQKLYWTDIHDRDIEVYDPITRHRQVLYSSTDGVVTPWGIVVDPTTGWFYWTDVGSDTIERASMDGTSRMVLHSTNIGAVLGITIDFANQVLYWADNELGKIETSNVDGSNRRILSTTILATTTMNYFNGSLYWGDDANGRVLTGPATQPGSGTFIGGQLTFDAHEIHVVSGELTQPQVPNPCSVNNGNCTHLCLLSSTYPEGYGCNCPDGLFLAGDRRTCSLCPDAFSCDNANCIASSEECDHTDDCGDNSDEDHCDAVPGSPIVMPPSTNLTSSATISWMQHPLGYVTNYSVSWTYSGPCTGVQGLDGTDVLTDGTTRNYTLIDLELNSEYSVQVVTTNNAGSSPAGHATVYTAFAVPDLMPPRNLTVLTTNATSVTINWDPISCLARHGVVTSIRVIIQELELGTEIESMDVGDAGTFTATMLRSGVSYMFEIFVLYGGTIGTSRESINATTVLVLPGIPVLLTANVTDTTASIIWMQDFSDNIDSFNITWMYSGPCNGEHSLDGFVHITDGSARTLALTGLQPNSEYFVRVHAINAIGSSSNNITVITSLQAPDVNMPPSNLRITMLTTTAVDIAWDPIECLQRHGLTLSIVVRIATGSLRVERVVPDTGAYRRDALQPDVSYTLGVFVCYENVVGEIGAMITVTTLPPEITLLYCEEEMDVQWSLNWPRTVGGTTSLLPCPLENSQGETQRQCFMNGTWSGVVDTSRCQREVFEDLLIQSGDLGMVDVAEVISNLSIATSPETTMNVSLFSRDIQTSTVVIGRILDNIEDEVASSQPGDLLPFRKELIISLDNLLVDAHSEGWQELMTMAASEQEVSTVFLKEVERFATYVGDAIVNERIDTGNSTEIMLSEQNIVLEAVSIPNNIDDIEDIHFPEEGESTFTKCQQVDVRSTIPADLLIERGAQELNLTAVNVKFCNLEAILPSFGNETEVGSSIISSQTVSELSREPSNSEFPVQFFFETAKFDSSNFRLEKPRCAFVDTTDPRSMEVWSLRGIETLNASLEEENGFIYYTVHCQSFHLTSFAVLVDIHGTLMEISEGEYFALSVVTYIGCGISIVFLAVSIAALASLGKELFSSVHFFVHLNLSIALLLGYIVFIAGLDHAIDNRVACAAVAALLNYLFIAVFCWMLCEGLMLYLMLVVVFSTLAKKWWFFMLLGWGLPLLPVVISVSAAPDKYGTATYCWLSVEDLSSSLIWLFIVPLLVVILFNAFILLAVLRSLYKVAKDKTGMKEGKPNPRLFWKLLVAIVILHPLLGLTWLFGLLAVSQNTTVFIWIFTILNSLQGLFVFIFHIFKNDQLTKKLRVIFFKNKGHQNTETSAIGSKRKLKPASDSVSCYPPEEKGIGRGYPSRKLANYPHFTELYNKKQGFVVKKDLELLAEEAESVLY